MNTHRSLPRQVIAMAYAVVDKMPPLKSKKNPKVAAVAGFTLGAFGLALYFGTLTDFFVPVAIWVTMWVFAGPTGGLSLLAAMTFCAVFGSRRAKSSNAKLSESGGAIIEAEIISEPPPLPTNRKRILNG